MACQIAIFSRIFMTIFTKERANKEAIQLFFREALCPWLKLHAFSGQFSGLGHIASLLSNEHRSGLASNLRHFDLNADSMLQHF